MGTALLLYLLCSAVAGLTLLLSWQLVRRPEPMDPPPSRWLPLALILLLLTSLLGVTHVWSSLGHPLPRGVPFWLPLATQALLFLGALLALSFGLLQLLQTIRAQERDQAAHQESQQKLQEENLALAEQGQRLKDAYHRLEQKAHFDLLTGLPNRPHFVSHLRGLLKKAKRHGQQLVLFRIRIEGLGSAAGDSSRARDSVIRELASRLSLSVREHDPMGRFSEGEFVVAMDDPAAVKNCHKVGQNLANALFKPLQRDAQRVAVRGHIGIALYPDDGLDPDQLFYQAESALEEAAATNAPPVAFADAARARRISDEQSLLDDLKQALEQDALSLYFIPQVEIATDRVSAVEALACWHQPNRGLVPPSTFLPLAEEAGLRATLGDTILEQACSQIRAWEGVISPHLQLSVNLSAAQLRQTDCVDHIQQILLRTGFPADRLFLEIPAETLALEHEACLPQMEGLKKLGVRLALDQFGGALTHLGLLDRLGVHTLKLDPALLKKMDDTSHSQTLVRSVMALAHNLSLATVVDGVETEEQCKQLQHWGATLGQGSYWSRPLPPEHLLPILEDGLLPPGNRMVFPYS